MAAEFSQESVLRFLQSHGGSVTNAELLLHFRPFLREHADRERNRELFKKFVNSVARVKQEGGVSHVVLQRRFRSSGGSQGESPGVSVQDNVHLSPLWNADKARNKSPEPRAALSGPQVLPAAGILPSNNNNNTEPNLNLPQRKVQHRPVPGASAQLLTRSEPPPPREHTELPGAQSRREFQPPLVAVPEHREAKLSSERAPGPVSSGRASAPLHIPQTSAPPLYRGLEAHVSPGQASNNMPQHREPPSAKPVPPHVSVSPVHSPQPARAPRTTARHRQSYRSALSMGDDDDEEEEEEEDDDDVEEVVPGRRASAPLESVTSALPSPDQGLTRTERPEPQKASPVRTIPQIHIQDVDPGSRAGSEPQPRFRTGFPLPVHNLSGSSSRVEQSPRTGRVSSGWSSCEELSRPGLMARSGQRSADEENRGQTGDRGWHGSTGDLSDVSAGSAPSPPVTLRSAAVARRQSSKLKRMCLSVGADLDQLMDEDEKRALGGSEAARLHRLQLISSSLSLRHGSSMSSLSSCSTPPRCQSLADLTDRVTPKEPRSSQSAPQHQEAASGQSHVPLEEREHLWLVKAASGLWPDIYSLFREDPSLLHRRDFMSGFTVLHWIAKHGDHRVLNTLWYGVEKAGLMFDTDAQSSCGYTPLHIAAIHNHKNIIRLLVNKFKANVSLRDASGRKAWFYLPAGAPPDLFQLLRAPAKAALGPSDVGQTWTAPQTHPQTQRRRRRHRFSSASGQRPLTFSGDAKVKRSSSLAAFLKHKSLQKVKAEWAI